MTKIIKPTNHNLAIMVARDNERIASILDYKKDMFGNESIDDSKLQAISKTLLDFILREIGITESTEIDIDYLTSIYQCFAVNGNCTVIEDLMGYKRDSITSQLKNKPINKFVGTYNVFIIRMI